MKKILYNIRVLIAQLMYPNDDISNYMSHYKVPVKKYYLWGLCKKILGFNRNVPWSVHFTSQVVCSERIERFKGHATPGWMPGCYIQALNRISFGKNVLIGPGAKIVSANHNIQRLTEYQWQVSKSFEDGNCVIAGNPATVVKRLEEKDKAGGENAYQSCVETSIT